jgi:Plasmid pRiA4b ORF-3-like protein/Uncharacterised protein family (UPF0158)
MARTWAEVTVELLGGRGTSLWPPPGRTLLIGPRHTFADLAGAIDRALARWDVAHLSQFELADGASVTDAESLEEADSLLSPYSGGHDMRTAKVMKLVPPGSSFRYVFDFGDDWMHACTLGTEQVDPVEVYGFTPRDPMVVWGWGDIPDQYGRRWAEDDGESAPPPRPADGHPMLDPSWPHVATPRVDLAQLWGAVARGDMEAILTAVAHHDVRPALQLVGAALEVVVSAGDQRARRYGVDVGQLLAQRDWPGDDVLVEDLYALVRGQELSGRVITTSLDEVAGQLEGSTDELGGFLDLRTGQVVPHTMTDAGEVGEDDAIDIDNEPDRWLPLPRQGSDDGWQDMAAFAAGLSDARLRDRLERDLDGSGAFRRFNDSIDESGLHEAWRAFSDERRLGRARVFLAEHGVRVLPAAVSSRQRAVRPHRV